MAADAPAAFMLSERLANDPSGFHHRQALEQLTRMREKLQAESRQLHDREAFRRLRALSAAVDAAIVVMREL